MSPLLWLVVPGAPLLALLLLLRWRDAVIPWLWLSAVPALLAAGFGPEPLAMEWLWPGANWHTTDLPGRAFLGFTAVLWAAASVYGVQQLSSHPQRQRFWVFWSLALCGNLLLLIAQDGASFYVGFTLMSLSAYALIVHAGGPGPRQAGRLYLQLVIIGELLVYAALMLRIAEAGGALDFASWQTTPISPLTAGLLLVGLGLKAGFFPLHVWLPLAHPAAPAAASAVLSGAMIKAGIIGLWRFLPEADPLLAQWAPYFIALGLLGAFYGVAKGLLQTQVKAVLAYSSVSQMGYMLIILALSWRAPEQQALWLSLLALYAVHHGLAKGALFMGAGVGLHHRLSPITWIFLAVPALALAGLPLTSGIGIKGLLSEGFYAAGYADWVLALSLGGAATALLLVRGYWLLQAQQRALPPDSPGHRVDYLTMGPLLGLCTLPLLVPLLWPAMRGPLLNSLTGYATTQALWPLALVALLILGLRWLPEVWQQPYHRWSRHSSRHVSARTASLRARRVYAPMFHQAPGIRRRRSTWGQRARQWERRWSRFWRRDKITLTTAWLSALFLTCAGWLLMTI